MALARWRNNESDADYLDRWLQDASIAEYRRLQTGIKSGYIPRDFLKDRLAEAVIAVILAERRESLGERGTEWQLALELLCTSSNIDGYIQGQRKLHRTVKTQIERIGFRVADFTGQRALMLYDRVSKYYRNDKRQTLGSFVKMVAITNYLNEASPYYAALPNKPSLKDIALARDVGRIDSRAAMLLKTFDYGAAGLTKDETDLLTIIWGVFNKGQKFPLAALSSKLNITSRSLKTQLSRWRQKVRSVVEPVEQSQQMGGVR